MGDDGGRLLERRHPGRAAGEVAQRVDAQQVQRAQLAGGRGLGDGRGVAHPVGGRLDLDVAGARVGQHAGLAQAAAVGGGGDLEQAGAVAARVSPSRRRGSAARAPRAAPRAPRSGARPEDHDVLAGAAQQRRQRAHRLAPRRPRRARAAPTSQPPASARGQRGDEGLARPGREAHAERWRWRPATTGGSSRRRAARRGGARPCGCAGRGSARRRRARSPSTSTAWANSRSGTVACSGRRGERARAAPAAACRPARESRSVESQRLAHEALQQEALLVGRAAAGERADALGGPAERRGGLVERALPAHRAQLAAVAHQRLGDALVAWIAW